MASGAPTHVIGGIKGEADPAKSLPLWPLPEGLRLVLLDAQRGYVYVEARDHRAIEDYVAAAEAALPPGREGAKQFVMCRRVSVKPRRGARYKDIDQMRPV